VSRQRAAPGTDFDDSRSVLPASRFRNLLEYRLPDKEMLA
jgi:hypothetical protein